MIVSRAISISGICSRNASQTIRCVTDSTILGLFYDIHIARSRYHREGGLELSLLALDWLAHSGDLGYFQQSLLPQIEVYLVSQLLGTPAQSVSKPATAAHTFIILGTVLIL